MNADIYVTNSDCKQCYFSKVVRTNESDFEEHIWVCQKGHHIEGQMDTSKKGCGLPSGEHYSAKIKVFTRKTKKG